MIRRFLKDERGATALEYGLIITLIVAAGIPAIIGISSKVNALFVTASTWF